jgi:soluble lytic murein transglycosylase-like protein
MFGTGMAFAAGGIYGFTDDDGVTHISNVPNTDRDPYKLILRVPSETRPQSTSRSGPSPDFSRSPEASPFANEILLAAGTFGLEPALLHAVITVESNHNPAALSRKGAMGLMQLMPGTSQRFGVSDPWQPEQNIRGGARYLSELLTMFDQDITLALAAYNAGEQAVIRHGRRIPPYPETRNYVTKVVSIYRLNSPGTVPKKTKSRTARSM